MPRLRSAYWLTALVFTALVAAKFDPQTGFTSLLRFGGDQPAPRLPQLATLPVASVPDSSGYDGQFYAQLAVDPTLRDPALARAIDAPAYRARRILVPATAFVLGFGQPAWILQLFALLNVGCWFGFALLLRREIAGETPAAFARWFACVFSLGVLESVRQSLVDLPALLLLLAAVRASRRPSPGPSAGWSALGHLAKETNLLATLALAAFPPTNRRRLACFALSALPLALWALYVSTRFPSGASSGLGNFTWPLLGALAQLQTSARAIAGSDFDSRHFFALCAIAGLFTQAVILVRLRALADPWWRIGVAYGILLVFLGSWVWSGYWASCRAVLPLTIAFNLLLPSNRAFWPLWVVGNFTLLHGVWRFL